MTVPVPFRPKAFQQITQDEIGVFVGICQKITDWNVGSIARTLLEAPAAVMEDFEYRTYVGIRDAIPIALYDAFNFFATPATRAGGYVTFYRVPAQDTDITIPLNSVATTSDGRLYVTVEEGHILSGTTETSVPVRASLPGPSGNTAPQTVTALRTSISGVTSIVNQAGITGGAPIESAAARKLRFEQYVSTLVRGTIRAVEVGAMSAMLTDNNGSIVEFVESARVSEPFLDYEGPIGYLFCYVDNGAGMASDALVAKAQQLLDGYVDVNGRRISGYAVAGALVVVKKVRPLAIDVAANLSLDGTRPFAAVQSDVLVRLDAAIHAVRAGKPLLIADLIGAAIFVPGVENISLATPLADVVANADQRIVAGTLSVDEVQQ